MTLLSVTKSSLGVGSIIDAVGPPDSTWALCDGSVLAQSLYPKYVKMVPDLHPFCWGFSEVITPPAHPLSKTGIAKKGSTIVVMPYNDNDVFYSTDDGDSWQTASNALPSSGLWTLVASNGTLFTALRSSSNAGAYSTDGISWNPFTMPASVSLSYLIWNGTVFIAGSSSSNATIYYSSDGYNWNTGPSFGVGVYPNTIPKNCDNNGYIIFQDSNFNIRRTNNGSSLSTSASPIFFNEAEESPTMFYFYYGGWWGLNQSSHPVWDVSFDGGITWEKRFSDNIEPYDEYIYPWYGSFDSGEEIVILDQSSNQTWVTRDGRSYSPRTNDMYIPENSVFISKAKGAIVLAHTGLSAGDTNYASLFRLKYTNYNYTTHFQLPSIRQVMPGMYKYIKVK